jgi:hypothetical protein
MRFRLPAAALLLLALAACTYTPAERFKVRGIVTDTLATLPGSLVYIIGADGVADSVKVKDGTFSYSGCKDETKLYTVVLRFPGRTERDTRFTAIFVPDSEVINIDLDYPVTVTGSPLTDAVNGFQEQVMNLYYEQEEVSAEGAEEDPAVTDSLYRVRMQKIVTLSRDTYLANTENVLGLQAISLLVTELDREELEALIAQGGEFIRENKQLKELIESK